MTTADLTPDPCLSLQAVEKHFAPRRSLLELTHLRSPSRLDVLRGVDLEVGQGQVVSLMGANGTGKTTLLRLAAGVLLPDAGRVWAVGGDPAKSISVRSSIGFLSSSERSFYWRLTARRNLLFWGSLQGLHGRGLKEAVSRAASLTGCESVLERTFEDISTGMRQRVGLARAILHRPRLLLLDEPTRSMDSQAAGAFSSLIGTLAEGGTAVLMSTHSVSEAGSLGDLTVRLERGVLREAVPHETASVEVTIAFAGDAPHTVPAGMTIEGSRLVCPADMLGKAVEWLQGKGLHIGSVSTGKPVT